MSKTLHRNLQAKMAVLQGPEWESSDEEETATPMETIQEESKQQGKESKKKKRTSKKQGLVVATDDDVSVIYIGHLPNEFEERDLRTFLMQFGDVERIRISRSVKTGKPRGYAFVKFTDSEVAAVVAETLQGYFLGKRRLVCHLVPNAHSRMFYDTDKVIERRKLKQEQEKIQRNRNLQNASKLKEITKQLVSREKQKRLKLKELGIDYDFPGYVQEIESAEATERTNGKKRKTSRESESAMKDETSSFKRKDSIGSETSESKKTKKNKKRKDSVGSEGSTKKSKRKDSVGSEASIPDIVVEAKSQRKKKKKKKSK